MSIGNTRTAIEGDSWRTSGRPTYHGRANRGRKTEGLLLSSRMANAILDVANGLTRVLTPPLCWQTWYPGQQVSFDHPAADCYTRPIPPLWLRVPDGKRSPEAADRTAAR